MKVKNLLNSVIEKSLRKNLYKGIQLFPVKINTPYKYAYAFKPVNVAQAFIKFHKNEQGFIIVLALLALLLLTAVGALVFNLTTQDIRVSTRSVGEKKAFSAAQAGQHRLIQQSNLNVGLIRNYTVTSVQVDPSSDPASRYSISNTNIQGLPGSLNLAAYEIGNWALSTTSKIVEGENTNYGSRVSIEVGVGYGPIPTDP